MMDTTEIQAEIVDMEAHVAFLVSLVADDVKALAEQRDRSARAYGTYDSWRWPAASYTHLSDLEDTLADRRSRLLAARAYLADLHAMAGV